MLIFVNCNLFNDCSSIDIGEHYAVPLDVYIFHARIVCAPDCPVPRRGGLYEWLIFTTVNMRADMRPGVKCIDVVGCVDNAMVINLQH